MRPSALPCLLLALLASGGCHSKSDAERAAGERAALEQRIRDSNTLVPYRALKLSLRAEGTGREPEEVATLWRLVEQTRTLPEHPATPAEAARTLAGYAKLGPALYATKQMLRAHDEDEFPLLWLRLRERPDSAPPLPGYDAGMEHLLVGALVVALDAADKSDRLPATELALYELARATPQPSWPASLRTVARGARGFSFTEAGYLYAAEEELGAYLAEVQALPPDGLGLLQAHGVTPAQEREGLRAAGHFLRARNRLLLERDEAATDDVEAGLAALQRLGVENELTWWGWAFVHQRRGRYAQAAASLEALARSPHVQGRAREDLLASAAAMRENGAAPSLLQQQRATAVLVTALVARAGGPEALLASVVGPRRAAQLFAPVAWTARVQAAVTQASPAAVVEGARSTPARGLAWLRQKLGAQSSTSTP